MARERAQLEGADEVRYAERAWRPRHPMGIEEIRDAVDALVVERRAFPEPAPVPEPEPVAPPVDEARAAALAPVVPGSLVAVETRYRVSQGEVVEATWQEGGATRKGLYLLSEGAARPFDDLEARIDALPEPTRGAPPAPVEQAPARVEEAGAPAASAPAEASKKKGFGLKLGRKKDKEPEAAPPEPAAEAPAPPAEGASKKRFGFGRK